MDYLCWWCSTRKMYVSHRIYLVDALLFITASLAKRAGRVIHNSSVPWWILDNPFFHQFSKNLVYCVFRKQVRNYLTVLAAVKQIRTYLMVPRCCSLYTMNPLCFLESFLRTLILITQISHYLFSLLELIWTSIIIAKTTPIQVFFNCCL